MICVCYKKVKVPKSYNCWEVVRDRSVGKDFTKVIAVEKQFVTV